MSCNDTMQSFAIFCYGIHYGWARGRAFEGFPISLRYRSISYVNHRSSDGLAQTEQIAGRNKSTICATKNLMYRYTIL